MSQSPEQQAREALSMHFEEQVAWVALYIRAAVAAEREECALEAERLYAEARADEIASAIRSRGKPR